MLILFGLSEENKDETVLREQLKTDLHKMLTTENGKFRVSIFELGISIVDDNPDLENTFQKKRKTKHGTLSIFPNNISMSKLEFHSQEVEDENNNNEPDEFPKQNKH